MRSSNTCVHVLHLLSDSTYVNDLKYVSPFIKEGILIHDRVKKKIKENSVLAEELYIYIYVLSRKRNQWFWILVRINNFLLMPDSS